MSHKRILAAGFGCTLLAGGAGAAVPGVTFVGSPEAKSAASFEVSLPLRNVDALHTLLTALHDPASPQYHKWLSPAQFGLRFGPDSATMARVTAALRARGFSVQTHTRSLHVEGTVAGVEAALGTHLRLARSATNAHGSRLAADGILHMPKELADAGAIVVSFGRHEAHVNSRVVAGPFSLGPNNRRSDHGVYWYNDLKQAYDYPSYETMVTVHGKITRLDGTGVTIGALISSDILASDIKEMFDQNLWSATTGTPDPTLFRTVEVDGGGGLTGGGFGEASLDTQQEIGGAPGAHVILYSIPDLSDGNIFAGYVTAIETNEVDILSSSFGGCELQYFPSYSGGQDYRGVLKAYDQLFMQGNAQGITFLASSGDSAGEECPSVGYFSGKPGHFKPGIESPADDPNVTAVGGTNLVTVYEPGSLDSAYATENAWSDPEIPYDPYAIGADVAGGEWGAGGGVSRLWGVPDYQSLVTTGSTRRSVPDIGMQVGGCPLGIAKVDKAGRCDGGDSTLDGNGNVDRSGVYLVAGGNLYGAIGTSVSSPEMASALALLVETHGRMGNVNEYLYRIAARQAKEGGAPKYLHTQIAGYDGLIQDNISPTYNAATGIGTPFVKMLIGQASAKSAGTPESKSNP